MGFQPPWMYKFIYKQISPKVIIFGYFSPRTWLYFCIVFICGIETCSRFDVTELIRPSLFSPGHDFKSSTLNPNISGSIYPFEEWYISFESSRHGEFLKKKWWLWHMHFKREFKVCGIQPKALLKGSTPLRMFMSSAHHSSHVSTAGGFEPGAGS